jgi:hypothetical protein
LEPIRALLPLWWYLLKPELSIKLMLLMMPSDRSKASQKLKLKLSKSKVESGKNRVILTNSSHSWHPPISTTGCRVNWISAKKRIRGRSCCLFSWGQSASLSTLDCIPWKYKSALPCIAYTVNRLFSPDSLDR